MSTIYSGFVSIPCQVSKCPRNLPELTPKAHLVASSLNLCFFKISNISGIPQMISYFFIFDHHVVNVGIHGASYHVPKHLGDHSLVCGSNIFQPKWHDFVMKNASRIDKCCLLLICLVHCSSDNLDMHLESSFQHDLMLNSPVDQSLARRSILLNKLD